jgi:hypothetical protein
LESDQYDEELEERDEVTEAEETKLVNDWEEREADSVDKGKGSESVVEVEVGRELNDDTVAELAEMIGIFILNSSAEWM